MRFLKDESDASWWREPDIIQHSARYVSGEYSDGLFAMLGIHRPPALERAVHKRCAEFLAGRHCAARVLARLGYTDQVGIGPNRSPTWPAGVAGSISHDGATAVAVATRSPGVVGLGIDIEQIMDAQVAQELQLQVINPAERHWLRHPSLSPEEALTLIFSAKESFFKAMHAQVGDYFGFEAVNVTSIESGHGQLHFALQMPLVNAPWNVGTHFVAEYRRLTPERLATLVVVRDH